MPPVLSATLWQEATETQLLADQCLMRANAAQSKGECSKLLREANGWQEHAEKLAVMAQLEEKQGR
jgi:hypothetical protein